MNQQIAGDIARDGTQNVFSHFHDRVRGLEGYKDSKGQLHGLILYYDYDKKCGPYKTSEFVNGALHGDTIHYGYSRPEASVPGTSFLGFSVVRESLFRYDKGVLVYSELYQEGNLMERSHEQGDGCSFCERLYPTGVLKERGTYQKFKEHGAFEYFDPDGSLVAKRNYVNGNLTGDETFSMGSPVRRTDWLNDLKHGKEVEFGRLRFAVTVDEELLTQAEPEQIRIERSFNKGKLTGPYLESIQGSIVVKGHYLNSEREGTWNYFNVDRTIARTETYRSGLLNGPLTVALSGTEAILGNMRHNQKNGQFDRINTLSRLPLFSIIYTRGIERYFVEYNTSGTPIEVGQFSGGEKHGIAITLNDDRSVRQHKHYEQGASKSLETATAISKANQIVVAQLKEVASMRR